MGSTGIPVSKSINNIAGINVDLQLCTCVKRKERRMTVERRR